MKTEISRRGMTIGYMNSSFKNIKNTLKSKFTIRLYFALLNVLYNYIHVYLINFD